MNMRQITDPISMHDVSDPEHHPCVYMGDGDNGYEVYFENEEHRQEFLGLGGDDDGRVVIHGSDAADYVAEG